MPETTIPFALGQRPDDAEPGECLGGLEYPPGGPPLEPAVPPGYFRCACCDGVFPKAWSEEEAQAELAATFPDHRPDEETAVLCDECYEDMMAVFRGSAANAR